MGKNQRAKQTRIADQKRTRRVEVDLDSLLTPATPSEMAASAAVLFQERLALGADVEKLITCVVCHQRAFRDEMSVCSADTSALWFLANRRAPGDWANYYGDLELEQSEPPACWDRERIRMLSAAPATNFWRMWALFCADLSPDAMCHPKKVRELGGRRLEERQARLAAISGALWQGNHGGAVGEVPPFLYVSSVPYELQRNEDSCWYQRSLTPEVTTERTLHNVFLHTQQELLYAEPHEGEMLTGKKLIKVLAHGLVVLRCTAEGPLKEWLKDVVIVGDEALGTADNIALWLLAGQSFIVQVPWYAEFHEVPCSTEKEKFQDKLGQDWSSERVMPDEDGLHHFVIRPEDPLAAAPSARAFVTNLAWDLGKLTSAALSHGEAQQNLREEYPSAEQPLPAEYFATPEHRQGYAILWYLRALLLRQSRTWLAACEQKHFCVPQR